MPWIHHEYETDYYADGVKVAAIHGYPEFIGGPTTWRALYWGKGPSLQWSGIFPNRNAAIAALEQKMRNGR